MSQSTGTTTIPQPQLRLPTAADVAMLAAERHPMCVSVLMTTTPSERLLPSDRATLQGLILDALRRLDEEPDREAAAATRAALAATVAMAKNGPTDRGLAILVSPEGTHLLHLRVAPRNRVVVDPTFATRDLLRSAAEDPAFLTLVIDGRAARLLHYGQRYTRPILGHDFPMIRPDEGQRNLGVHGWRATEPGRSASGPSSARSTPGWLPVSRSSDSPWSSSPANGRRRSTSASLRAVGSPRSCARATETPLWRIWKRPHGLRWPCT